jgi:hypothetical protein
MANFDHLEQAMRAWVQDAVEYLSHTEPDVSPGLSRWQRDSDGLFRKSERPIRVWQHSDLEAVRQLPSWQAVEQAFQEDDRLAAHANTLVGTAQGARRFEVEMAGRLVLPRPDEVKDLDAVFARRYENLDGFLAATEIEYVVVWPLPGLSCSDFPVQLEPDIVLDLLSDDELAAVLNTEVLKPDFPDVPIDPAGDQNQRACLRSRYRLPKTIGDNKQSPADGEAVENRLIGLQERMEQVLALLFAEPVAVSGRASLHTDWTLLSGGVAFLQLPLSNAQRFRRLDLDAQAAKEVVEAWRLVSPGLLQSQKALALALRRLSYQAYRQRIEDEMIDIMVAAEAMYLTRTEIQELGFRLALRSAALSDAGALDMTRRQIFDLMKAAYNVRSTIVHGDEPKPKDLKVKGVPVPLSDFVQATEDVVRQGLRHALNKATDRKDKWPPDWDGLTLPK